MFGSEVVRMNRFAIARLVNSDRSEVEEDQASAREVSIKVKAQATAPWVVALVALRRSLVRRTRGER